MRTPSTHASGSGRRNSIGRSIGLTLGLALTALTAPAHGQAIPPPQPPPVPQNTNAGSWVNTTFIINNQSGLSAEKIWVSFNAPFPVTQGLGAFSGTSYPQTLAGTTPPTPVNGWTSVTLKSLIGPTGIAAIPSAPTFSLNNWQGRVYFSYGTNAGYTASVPLTDPYGLWELLDSGIVGAQTSTTTTIPNPYPVSPATTPATYYLFNAPAPSGGNGDISYVDGATFAMATQICDANGNALAATTVNPVSTNPNLLSELAKKMPANTVVKSATTTNPIRVLSAGSMSTFTPSEGMATPTGYYHDWKYVLAQLKLATQPALTVASYTSPATATDLQPYHLAGVLFGFAPAPPIAGNPLPNAQNGQSYSLALTFTADLNPATNSAQLATILAGQGIPQTNPNATPPVPPTPGVIFNPSVTTTPPATSCPLFQIYITDANLNAARGIYGNNPFYTVVPYNVATPPFSAYTTQGLVNDVTGRIVGDLVAGITFGWPLSTKSVSSPAVGSALPFVSELGFPAGATVNSLTSGQFFALMSLAGSTPLNPPAAAGSAVTTQVNSWICSGLSSNSNTYDVYADAVAKLSGAYGSALGDRFQGLYNPDTSWYSANPPAINGTTNYSNAAYVQLTLLPNSTVAADLDGAKDIDLGYAATYYDLAGKAFAAEDTQNGYYYLSYSSYFSYLSDVANGKSTKADLNAYYTNLAVVYYVAYAKQGDIASGLAWYNYILTFVK